MRSLICFSFVSTGTRSLYAGGHKDCCEEWVCVLGGTSIGISDRGKELMIS